MANKDGQSPPTQANAPLGLASALARLLVAVRISNTYRRSYMYSHFARQAASLFEPNSNSFHRVGAYPPNELSSAAHARSQASR